MKSTELPLESERHLHLFRKSVPLQVELQEVVRAVGGTDGLCCLDMGAGNAMFSYQLRKQGGKWQTAVSSPEMVDTLTPLLGEGVHLYRNSKLPFKKKTFDIVVITGCLERENEDEAFIAECHRVLKTDGRLVLCVRHLKPLSIITWCRKLFGKPMPETGFVRRGYGESELFRILKNGFDVLHMRSYQRFFVELADILGGNALRRKKGVRNLLYPLYRLAYQLDMLLLFTRGFRLIATAKRRVWLPRNAPVLVDGRSISQAVLSKASN